MNKEDKDIAIETLTKMLIKQALKDKKKGTITYVKKTAMFKNLIKLFKELL